MKITVRNLAMIKRVAQNVNPLVSKKQKLFNKIEDIKKQIQDIESEIQIHESGVKALTGGYTSEDLVEKVVELTDKIDTKGNPVKVTKYIPTSLLKHNEEENCYYIEEVSINSEEENNK